MIDEIREGKSFFFLNKNEGKEGNDDSKEEEQVDRRRATYDL